MSVQTGPPSRRVLSAAVHAAGSAPSLHNSQPWRFRIGETGVEVFTDPERRLTVIDPVGREQLISVGAAVFTLRLALARAGFRTATRLLPSPSEPELVAVVSWTGHAPATPAAAALAAAVPHRHTSRWPFDATPVAEAVLDQVRSAAAREGAALAVAGPVARTALLGLARSADRSLRARPGYRRELARWTGCRVRHDGVPAWAAGAQDAGNVIFQRDFAELTTMPRPSERFEPAPTLLVLTTAGDEPADWVRAGQALQRVLLTATWHNVAAAPMSQLIEVPSARFRLTGRASGRWAQAVLRVGYGRARGATPRRLLADTLMPPGPPARHATPAVA